MPLLGNTWVNTQAPKMRAVAGIGFYSELSTIQLFNSWQIEDYF